MPAKKEAKGSSHVDFYLLHGSDDAPAPAPGSELAQFILGFLPRLSMDTDVDSFSVLPKTEAKELKISNCEHADRSALFPVHFQLQCLDVYKRQFPLWTAPAAAAASTSARARRATRP